MYLEDVSFGLPMCWKGLYI